TRYEEACGHHIITQGGYYQYDFGLQLAYRDPLSHVLPVSYSNPALAREVLEYSLAEQDGLTGDIPYGRRGMCEPITFAKPADFDLWSLMAVTDYVEATRDFAFLDATLPYANGGSARVWDHLKLAVQHVDSVPIGPHGLPTAADLDGLHLSETTLV